MRELFVPGRLCLFGEHSDWAGGYRRSHPHLAPGACLVAGTDQGLHARSEPRDAVLAIESELADGRREAAEIPLEPGALEAVARRAGFFSYVAGTAAVLLERHSVGGLQLRVRADLPVGRGLSSSAAVCVLVARAFGEAYGLGLQLRDEMELAYEGERRAGSECGRMDQVCAYGSRPTRLHIDGEHLEVEPVDPGREIPLLVVDLRRGKDTRRILADLNACFPDAPGPVAADVRAALGEENRAMVDAACDAVEQGDRARLGGLMREAQERFDRRVAPASPEALAAPRLREVLSHPAVAELAWGGKGVGSQGDGCAQLVARGDAEREVLAARLERDLGVVCGSLTLRPAAAEEQPGEAPPPRPLPSRMG